ncbi:Rac GTPase-activating protein 1 [Blomia tropicalis]|nr:Rac GTPase-activating protein 1 [Blomia tropicalis]
MLSHSKSSSGLVPVLVDQFNDIIELKAQVLAKEIESFEATKQATTKTIPLFDEQIRRRSYSTIDDIQRSSSTTSFPKMKRSKTQKCFTKKLNRIRMKAIDQTICECTETIPSLESVCKENISADQEIDNIVERIERLRMEYKLLEPIKDYVDGVDDDDGRKEMTNKIDPLIEIDSIDQPKLNNKYIDSKPDDDVDDNTKMKKIESIIPTYNVLLEKLRNVYRHNFVVKTVVVDIGSRVSAALGKSASPTNNGECLCGQMFTFSDKTLQCISCLTTCHTRCGSTVPIPCIRFVDPNLRPSKLITNYVYPRTKPSIPSLIVHCCRLIESKCSSNCVGKSMKLYYVESERLQPVKDQCRRLLSNGRTGLQPSMEQINLEHLCGIVKHFLSDICEPVFSANNWKDYSIHIHKRSDLELAAQLLETFDQMASANIDTLCFMLLHLKHLNRLGYQDLDILADIFCPILMGDVEVRRKLRLMKLMFNIEDNVLASFVER